MFGSWYHVTCRYGSPSQTLDFYRWLEKPLSTKKLLLLAPRFHEVEDLEEPYHFKIKRVKKLPPSIMDDLVFKYTRMHHEASAMLEVLGKTKATKKDAGMAERNRSIKEALGICNPVIENLKHEEKMINEKRKKVTKEYHGSVKKVFEEAKK